MLLINKYVLPRESLLKYLESHINLWTMYLLNTINLCIY